MSESDHDDTDATFSTLTSPDSPSHSRSSSESGSISRIHAPSLSIARNPTNETALLSDIGTGLATRIARKTTQRNGTRSDSHGSRSSRADTGTSSTYVQLSDSPTSSYRHASRSRASTHDIELEERGINGTNKSYNQADLNLGDINEGDIDLYDVPISRWRSVYHSQRLAISYVWAEIKREKRAFLIGLFTIFLVVMFTAVLQNGVLKSPLIFFKISENSVGENDLVLTPGAGIQDKLVVDGGGASSSGLPLLNHSLIAAGVTGRPMIRGATPRWVLFGRVLQPADRLTPVGPNYSNIKSASTILLGMNSLQERQIELGRAWPFPPMEDDQVIVARTVVRQIGKQLDTAVGESILLRLDLFDLVKAIGAVDSQAGADVQGPAIRGFINRIYPNATQIWNRTISFPEAVNSYNMTQMLDDFSRLDLSNQTQVNAFIHQTIIDNWYTNFTLPSSMFGNMSIPGIHLTNTNLAQLLLDVNTMIPPGVPRLTQNDFINGIEQIINQTLATQNIDDLQYMQRSLQIFVEGPHTYAALFDTLTPLIRQFTRVDRIFRIAGIVEEPQGKWPTSLGSVTAMEERTMFKLFRDTALSFLTYNATGINIGTFPAPNGGVIGPIFIPIPGVDEISVSALLQQLGVANNRSDAEMRVRGLENSVQTFDENQYALLSVIQYTDRVAAYVKKLRDMNLDFIHFTNQASIGVGVNYPATWTVPIVTALQITVYIRYFLDTVFGSIIALVVVLGALLIFSLLLADIESKTYEYGMLRALGMKNTTLIQLLLTKATAFSIPGIACGLFVAFLLNIPIARTIAGFAEVPPEYTFIASAVIVATVIGFVMPLLANIIPISRALGKTLRDALDIYHNTISDVTVKVIKLAELGLDLWQTAVAFLLVSVGALTFYGVPYAFTFGDIPLLLGILNAILLGMLFGLCLMAQMVQPYVERVFLWSMCYPYHRHLYGVVKKNLAGHRGRNRKTALMFTLCLGFIIFAGVMFSLQAASLGDNVKMIFGADINISSLPKATGDALDEAKMRIYLEDQVRRRKEGDPNAVVVDFTFVTYAMQYYPGQNDVWFASFSQQWQNQYLFGVEQNYLDVAYSQFFMPTSVNDANGMIKTSTGLPDAVRMMFTYRGESVLPIERNGIHVPPLIGSGSKSLKIGTAYNDTITALNVNSAYTDYIEAIFAQALSSEVAVNVDTPMQLWMSQWMSTGYTHHTYLVKPRAFAAKIPGFLLSSYRQAVRSMNAVIPMDQFNRIYRDRRAHDQPSPDDGVVAPKWRVLIRVVDGASKDLREDVINGLRPSFSSDKIIVTDTRDIVDTLKIATDMMSLFFQVVGVIAMVMCFFILWLSFTANVRENAWEFGVLRAVGLNSFQSVMVYVYEALSLVLASVILGTGIGILIAASLTLQFNLFTEMPFVMNFPHSLFWSMLILSLLVAIIGSAVPARHFIHKSISNVIRGI